MGECMWESILDILQTSMSEACSWWRPQSQQALCSTHHSTSPTTMRKHHLVDLIIRLKIPPHRDAFSTLNVHCIFWLVRYCCIPSCLCRAWSILAAHLQVLPFSETSWNSPSSIWGMMWWSCLARDQCAQLERHNRWKGRATPCSSPCCWSTWCRVPQQNPLLWTWMEIAHAHETLATVEVVTPPHSPLVQVKTELPCPRGEVAGLSQAASESP